MTAASLSPLHQRLLRWLATAQQRTQARITSSSQARMRALQRDRGKISHSLRTLEVRGWMVIGRSSHGKTESLRRPPEGQKWAS